MPTGILSFGGYSPRARLSRKAIAGANAWFNPGLAGLAKGERAMANWDEDALTMAVEAARGCLTGQARDQVQGVYMASTTFPFLDRQNAGIVAEALNLRQDILTLDIASSRKGGTSALSLAANSAPASGPLLVVAAEKRQLKAATPQEMTAGDAAAALLVGEGEPVARLIGQHSRSVDFVDHFRSAGQAHEYHWEERWVRDEGYMKLVPEAVGQVLAMARVEATRISHFCLPAPNKRISGDIANKLGIYPDAVRDTLQGGCGDSGTAHPLLMLVHALEDAAPGDMILVAGFGQGCDALLFEVTEEISRMKDRGTVGPALADGRVEENYVKFLAFNDLIVMDHGLRAEVDKNTGLSTLYRNHEMSQGLVGGQCDACGTVQFPKSDVCVNPDCGATGRQTRKCFADMAASLKSYTADRLTYSMDPPAYYGMVQFAEGGQMMMDFTDIDPSAELAVGTPMRLMFRVKDYDKKRGFRRYFWKAVPVSPAEGG